MLLFDRHLRAAQRAAQYILQHHAKDQRLNRTATVAARAADAEVDGLRAQIASLQSRVDAAAEDVVRERSRAKTSVDRARRAEAALAELTEAVGGERETWSRDEAAYAKQIADLRRELADATAAVERLRRDTRDAREAADVRRWLLLDTLSRAVRTWARA